MTREDGLPDATYSPETQYLDAILTELRILNSKQPATLPKPEESDVVHVREGKKKR